MESNYFADFQEMGLAGSLLYPNSVASSQQLYYEYSTDYLYVPPAQSSNIYGPSTPTNFPLDPVSGSQIGIYPPVYAANFQPNSIENVPFESSVFLSPQTSASSSVAPSPHAETQQHDAAFDLSLDEIFDVDDLLISSDLISDELLDVFNDVGSGDFLNELVASQNFDNSSSCTSESSAPSTPKRKYSTDSSDCSSLDSFETCSSLSSNGESNKKPRRTRQPKTNPQERASRKKDQNKKAASRYRNKKKSEVHTSEQTLDELESHRDSLLSEVKKLQTEFNVILPLAKAAFTFDSIRREHLDQLISRINHIL